MPKPATAPPAVLLLGWDDSSPALPLAQALAATVATELWTALPLAAGAPAGLTARSLDAVPPLPALPGLGTAAPAFPYLGSLAGSQNQAGGQPGAIAVPAAPYVGSSAAPAGLPEITRPATPAAGAPAGAPTRAYPSAPYVGATHPAESPEAVSAELLSAPRPDYRVPIATLPASPDAVAPGAEPGAAEAAELSSPEPAAAPELVVVPPADLPAVDATTVAPPETSAAAEPASPAPTPPADSAEPTVSPADLNFRIIQYARHAARLAHGSAFELIFAADWHTWLAGVELRQLTRRPLVLQLTQLATDLASPAQRGWVEALERITLPHADRVLVPDEATAARLRQRYRLPAERVQVLPPGTAPDLTAALVLNSRFTA
jgi:hypothetical protein